MRKLLVLVVFSVSLMGCISSRYQAGMTEIGLPEPLPSEPRKTVTSPSFEDEAYATWIENCQAKLGTEILRDVRITMTYPRFDLEEGWGTSKPRIAWSVPELDFDTQFVQHRFANRLRLPWEVDTAVIVDAVIGRFIVNNPSDTTLEYLSNMFDEINQRMTSPITMRKTSAKVWESNRIALSMRLGSVVFPSFLTWLDQMEKGKTATTAPAEDRSEEPLVFSDLAVVQLENVIPESATIGASFVGATGSIRFEPAAANLTSHLGTSLGCLKIND